MAKTMNGTWKMIAGIVALAGLALTAAGLVWQASTINSAVAINIEEDKAVHPTIHQNELKLRELNKDITVTQRDINRIEIKLDAQAQTQEAILSIQREILREVTGN